MTVAPGVIGGISFVPFAFFMTKKIFPIYILTNRNKTVLYTGVTSDIRKRVSEHITKLHPNSFTARYNTDQLVYFEPFDNISDAITREKQIKSGSRQKKIDLINALNPTWKDLYKEQI